MPVLKEGRVNLPSFFAKFALVLLDEFGAFEFQDFLKLAVAFSIQSTPKQQ
jgi:hypothetical protein